MADAAKRLTNNVPGEFFVDSTCINCDTCRQLAPEVFEDSGDYSYVHAQPTTEEERRKAVNALICCPTGSIGTEHKNDAREVMQDFPMPIDEDIYYCGFNSPKSYGGNSYFVVHSAGNWLVDSPKYLPQLVSKFEAMGGIKYIFLSHQDDVADAEKYAERFGAACIIHSRDAHAISNAQVILEGEDVMPFGDDFLVIPTPGHTAGHCVLLYRSKYLFTGDHLWWNRYNQRLGASKGVCWYSWKEQVKSMARLAEFAFEWVLPGHGQRIHLPLDSMRTQLSELVERMKAA